MTANYRLRFFFDWGGPCLWSGNDAARDAFGYPVELSVLPLSPETVTRGNELLAWHYTALNQDYPPDPITWSADECHRFNAAARGLLATIRVELGRDFEIIDEFEDMAAG